MTVQETTRAAASADITSRLIAFVIDGVILGIVYTFLLIFVTIGAAIGGDVGIVGVISRSAIWAVVSALYFGYGWTNWRATPGQRAMGLITVKAEDQRTLNWTEALTRWAYLFGPAVLQSLFGNANQVGGLISLIVTIAVIVYCIYLFRTTRDDPRGQGFHDKQSGTIVLKAST